MVGLNIIPIITSVIVSPSYPEPSLNGLCGTRTLLFLFHGCIHHEYRIFKSAERGGC